MQDINYRDYMWQFIMVDLTATTPVKVARCPPKFDVLGGWARGGLSLILYYILPLSNTSVLLRRRHPGLYLKQTYCPGNLLYPAASQYHKSSLKTILLTYKAPWPNPLLQQHAPTHSSLPLTCTACLYPLQLSLEPAVEEPFLYLPPLAETNYSKTFATVLTTFKIFIWTHHLMFNKQMIKNRKCTATIAVETIDKSSDIDIQMDNS